MNFPVIISLDIKDKKTDENNPVGFYVIYLTRALVVIIGLQNLTPAIFSGAQVNMMTTAQFAAFAIFDISIDAQAVV